MTDANKPIPPTAPITIVSGLPRSGTSLMMQMLVAGGIPALTDGVRKPDEDNPRGYLELEAVKNIKTERAWLDAAAGKCVKLVHLLLLDLPMDAGYRYNVVFMRRDLGEVIKSQSVMLARAGKAGAQLSAHSLTSIYQHQVDRVLQFLAREPNARVLEVNYNELVRDARVEALRVAKFIGTTLDAAAMAAAIDPALYRNRST